MNGEKRTAPVMVEKKRTGNTALFSSDFLREISYIPRNKAEMMAKVTHISIYSRMIAPPTTSSFS